MLKTFLARYTFSSNYPEQSTRAQPAARSLTVYTTTECRRSRMFPLAGKRCCTCVSGVIAACAASASLRKISFSQDTTESPADWSLRSSVRFMNWYPLQKLAHATTSLGRPQRDISNTSPLSRPNCRKSSPSTNSRATPGEKSTTALSWMLKSTKWSIFYQIALRTILSNISHNSHPKPV